MRAGEPVARLVVILGAVIAVTLAAAVLLESGALRRWYAAAPGRGGYPGPPPPR